MDDNINDDELQFVLDHYKPGCLDTERAWQRLQDTPGMRRHARRRFAVAMAWAAAFGLAAAAGITGYSVYMLSPDHAPHGNVAVPIRSDSTQCDADTTDIFYFDNTPVNEALGAISQQYGVQLSASDTTKRVSGEIEASTVDEAIGLLETTVGIKITKKR